MNEITIFVRKAQTQYYMSFTSYWGWERISKALYYKILEVSAIPARQLPDDDTHEKYQCTLLIDNETDYNQLRRHSYTMPYKNYIMTHPSMLKPEPKIDLMSFEELFM